MDERLKLDRKREDEIGIRHAERKAKRDREREKRRQGEGDDNDDDDDDEMLDLFGGTTADAGADAVADAAREKQMQPEPEREKESGTDGGEKRSTEEKRSTSPGSRRTTRSVSQATEAVGLNWEVELEEYDLAEGGDGRDETRRRPATPTLTSGVADVRSSPSYARRALEDYGRTLVAYYVSLALFPFISSITRRSVRTHSQYTYVYRRGGPTVRPRNQT